MYTYHHYHNHKQYLDMMHIIFVDGLCDETYNIDQESHIKCCEKTISYNSCNSPWDTTKRWKK